MSDIDQPIAVFSSPAHPSSGLYSQNLHRFPLHVQLGALLEQFYIEYQKYSEIALVFAFFRYVIGPENSRYFLNQSDSKPKPIPTWSLTVSRAFQGWKEDLPRNVSFSPLEYKEQSSSYTPEMEGLQTVVASVSND